MAENKKLIIEIELDGNDLLLKDFEKMLEESKDSSGILIEVGRPIDDERSEVFRSYSLSAEYFKMHIEGIA